MMTTKQANDMIDTILDYVEVLGNRIDEAYPDISMSDRKKIVNILKDISEGK